MNDLDAGRVRPWFDYDVVTFSTTGIAAATYLFALANPAGSGRLVVPKRVKLVFSNANTCTVDFAKTTQAAAGGTVLVPTPHLTLPAVGAVAVALGGTASDGGVATAITIGGAAPPPAVPLHFERAVMPAIASANLPLTVLDVDDSVALQEGQSLSVRYNALTGSAIVKVWWRELVI